MISNINKKSSDDFMRYATAVIKGRAVPNVDDNLKPVHRRILYTMHDMKLDSKAKTTKCANIVGQCMSRHPHGDASIYDAIVRLSQDWKMRYPLIDMQGNNGSLTGDVAASMRYTEARLTKVGDWILKGVDPAIVPFISNYDDTKTEPTSLPSIFPNILCNGNEGIAVGMSSKLVPHNFTEVANAIRAMLDKPLINLADIMKYIKGPDFPLGGTIIDGYKLPEIYATGHGTLTLRAKSVINPKTNTIDFSEFPYLVDVETRIVRDIKKMVNDGYDAIENVEIHIGKSSRHITVVLDKKADPNKVLAELYAKTALQKSQGINHLVIKNGVPANMGLISLLRDYINHQHQIIIKMATQKRKEQERIAHIQKGLALATAKIDEVIVIIRGSNSKDEARRKLMDILGTDLEQTEAILSLQLGRLTRLDVDEITIKINKAEEEVRKATELIENRETRVPVIKENLDQMLKLFGDERRTTIEVGSAEKMMAEEFPEGMSTIISDGRLVTIDLDKFEDVWKRGNEYGKYSPINWVFNEGKPVYVINHDGTTATVVTSGKSSKYLFVNDSSKDMILTVTKNGYVKKTSRKDYKNISKLCRVKDDDKLMFAFSCNNDDLAVFWLEGDKAKVIPVAEIKDMGKLTLGNKLLKDAVILGVFVAKSDERFFTVNEKGQAKACEISELGTSIVTITPTTKFIGVAKSPCFYLANGKVKEVDWSTYSNKGKTAVGAILDSQISSIS